MSTFPPLFDEALQISITYLKNNGYIVEGEANGGTLIWRSSRTSAESSIGFRVDLRGGNSHMVVSYNYGDTPIRYTIDITTQTTNIGNGTRHYCPNVRKPGWIWLGHSHD